MFKAVVTLALLSSASSFHTTVRSSGVRSMLSAATDEAPIVPAEAVAVTMPSEPVVRKALKAQWLPVGNLMAPIILDGSLAGDVGFDPLGFSKTRNTLLWMREAELKHSRLAMLAAIGWPLSELWHKQIAQAFGLESILAGKSGSLAPSLLNGGLSSVYATGMLIMSIIIAGLLEGQAMNKGDIFISNEKSKDYVPGDFKFDPLNLYKIRGDKKTMELTEIKNGRMAMMAITFYAFSEFATKLPVIEQTPFLF